MCLILYFGEKGFFSDCCTAILEAWFPYSDTVPHTWSRSCPGHGLSLNMILLYTSLSLGLSFSTDLVSAHVLLTPSFPYTPFYGFTVFFPHKKQ